MSLEGLFVIKILFYIFAILFNFSAYALAQEDISEVCHQQLDFMKKPFDLNDILHEVYAKFNGKDERGEKLKFRAQEIIVEDDVIIFKEPRLNKKVIQDQESICSKSVKIFLGMEVCQEIIGKSIADDLCMQLGHHSAEKALIEKVSSTSEGLAYRKNKQEWSILRFHSFLAPAIYYTRVKELRCKIKK